MPLEHPFFCRRRRLLVARRRVDAVHVDVALLRGGRIERVQARRRRVHERLVDAGCSKLLVRGVGDKAVVPPRLERAHVVVVVVGYGIPNLKTVRGHCNCQMRLYISRLE